MNKDYINHSKPRGGDHVLDYAREREGKQGMGEVLQLDWESRTVLVCMFGGNPICVNNDYSYCAHCIHHPAPEVKHWYRGGGEVEEYSLESFEGNWSSHDGGDGMWHINV